MKEQLKLRRQKKLFYGEVAGGGERHDASNAVYSGMHPIDLYRDGHPGFFSTTFQKEVPYAYDLSLTLR